MSEKPQPVFTVKPVGDGFTVFRDDAPLQTPRTLAVTLPTQKLAAAIQAECSGQGEKLDLRKMPLTQMALTALDITANHRGEVVDGIMRFGESELLCQRATEPDELVAEQAKIWQPYLDWCQTKFGVSLQLGSGILPVKQKPENLDILRGFVESFDAFRLTGISEAVGISGSLVLGLALVTRHIEATTAMESAELDGLWQAKKWGEDPATLARQKAIKDELEICARWLELLT